MSNSKSRSNVVLARMVIVIVIGCNSQSNSSRHSNRHNHLNTYHNNHEVDS